MAVRPVRKRQVTVPDRNTYQAFRNSRLSDASSFSWKKNALLVPPRMITHLYLTMVYLHNWLMFE